MLDAAARLFAERGYHDTTVPDIVNEAGVGHGTFYEYFRSRRDILVALTEPVNQRRRTTSEGTGLAERVRAEIFWYLSDHVEHLTLSKVWRDAVHVDHEIAATRRVERARRVRRVRQAIESAGAPEGVDPAIAAAALMAMLEEFAHRWFVEGDGPGRSAADVLDAAETLAALWLGALGMRQGAAEHARPAPKKRGAASVRR